MVEVEAAVVVVTVVGEGEEVISPEDAVAVAPRSPE